MCKQTKLQVEIINLQIACLFKKQTNKKTCNDSTGFCSFCSVLRGQNDYNNNPCYTDKPQDNFFQFFTNYYIFPLSINKKPNYVKKIKIVRSKTACSLTFLFNCCIFILVFCEPKVKNQ